MHLTDHAILRAKERCRWTEKALHRMAAKALTDGIRHSDTAGNLHRYLTKLFLTHHRGDNTRIYGDNIFIFQKETLITILNLPQHLRRAALAAKPLASRSIPSESPSRTKKAG